MTLLQVNQLSKRYGDTQAVDRVSLSVAEGEIVCLLGPSGCGKTTLLRLIAGLEMPDSGSIHFAGRDLAGVPVHQRNFGFMFQDYALFPHKSVTQNVAFGLRMLKQDQVSIDGRVQQMLALVGLAEMGEREVTALSGGEQQRVALARSLAPNPQLLLLDEPLGSLDRALRERLMNEMRVILKQVGVTVITVTHDQQEAFALADTIVVMDAGRALQVASPEQVYRQPAAPAVARFLGLTNLLPGQITQAAPLIIQTVIGSLPVAPPPFPLPRSPAPAVLLIRPEAAATCAAEETIPLRGVLKARSFRGRHYQIELEHTSGQRLTFVVRANPADLPAVGQELELHLDPGGITLLPQGD